VSYLDDLFSLAGRSAVVTGGSSGIGAAAAVALGRAGAAVTIVARDEGRIEESVRRLRALGVEASGVSVDLADALAVADLCASDALMECDVLVTCAGVNHRPPMAQTTPDQLGETLQVNLLAPYHLGQAAGPRMAARGFGRIVNVGSQQMWSAFGNSGVYGMTKAGVGGLTRSQAEAWSSSGVTVNTIVPGFVVTRMTQQTIAEPGREQALAARSLVGRNAVPADFESAVVFLAAPSSAYMTGQTLAVDGGFAVH
jgi:NAD(P)-dependent dehydrogenase (short-subunit alcohol dehydrogenase family)